MASSDQNSNAVLQGIARYINCLGEENRNVRKRALVDMKNETVLRKPPLDSSEIQPIFNEVLKPLLKTLSDPVEKCRELAICMLVEFFKLVDEPVVSLPYVIPVLVQRLGQQDITEPSEELRLILIEMLHQIIIFSKKNMSVYVDDSLRILQRTILDPFADVKKESCRCSSDLANNVPEQFHMQSASLIKPLLETISHQHSSVRVVVVDTIGDILLHGNGKTVDDVISHLAQRLFDDTPAVRKSVIKVVGSWLLDLLDRYSFHHKLIPLLLTGLTDEQPSIQELADGLWHDVGMKYQSENENDLKDKMDFPKAEQEHYPRNVERPNLGCRTLVLRHISKILPGLLRDMMDWVAATRIKSAALLYVLLLNAEDNTTQHMEKLLQGLYRGTADEEKEVIRDVRRSAELIGYFVHPEIWCKMVLVVVKDTQSAGSLMVLAAIIRGAQRAQIKPYLLDISQTIANPDVCQSIQGFVQLQLLACVEGLIAVSQDDCAAISLSLFHLTVTILALLQEATIRDMTYDVMDKLAKVQGDEGRQALYDKHTKQVLESFQDSYPVWTNHSSDRLVFDMLLMEAGPVIGELLDDIIPVFIANLRPDKDPEVRLKFFSLLSKLVMNAAATLNAHRRFEEFAVSVLTDMILPNCVWKAGRTAGAIRTTSVSCLWAMLQSGVLTKEMLQPIVEDMLTQMITLLEDDIKSTRLITCRVITRTFDLMGSLLGQDRLHNTYPDLLKRLDDSSDEIRVMVTKTFLAYFDCFGDNYDAGLYRAHLESLYKGLLVHLDDPEAKIREAILGVLKRAGQILPAMLIKETETIKHKHRSQKYCDELLLHLQSLTQTQS